MKRCWKCGLDLETARFFRDRSRGDGLDPICKDCRKAKETARRLADPARWSATVRSWQVRNPERFKEICRRSRLRNPIPQRLRVMRRRARLVAAAGTCTTEQMAARAAYYGWKCWICRVAPWESIDHVIPLSKGGSNWPSNLRPACLSCNSRKRDKRVTGPKSDSIAHRVAFSVDIPQDIHMKATITVTRCDFHEDADAVSLITFAVAGKGSRRELDVCQECLDSFNEFGRPAIGDKKKKPHRANGTVDTNAVRQWAAENGFKVATRGMIPRHVVEQYRKVA